MTIWDTIRALRKWWYVGLAGLLLTGIMVVATTGSVERGYWTDAKLVLLAPQDPIRPNALESASESLIAMAGVVERDVNQDVPASQTSSGSVNVLDIGIDNGWLVRLPNSGGQWASNFDQPLLDVQASGPTPSEVKRNLGVAVSRIQEALDRIQAEAGVGSANLVKFSLSPGEASIVPAAGYKSRAGFGVMVLGLALTVGTVMALNARSRSGPTGVRRRMSRFGG